MRKIKFLALAAVCLAAVGCTHRGEITADYNVVPLPQQIDLGSGAGFTLNSDTRIAYPEGDSALQKECGAPRRIHRSDDRPQSRADNRCRSH